MFRGGLNPVITLALVFYSIGVWAQLFSRKLKGWYVAAIWLITWKGGMFLGMPR